MSAPKEIGWPRHSLFVLAGFFFAYFVGWALSRYYSSTPDVMHRFAGGVLQLLGVLTMALGISQMRRMFGLPGTFAEVTSEWRDYMIATWWRVAAFFGKKRPGKIVTGSGALTAGGATMRGHATVGPGANASLDQRVKMLEDQVVQLSKTIFDVEGKLLEEVKKRADALEQERKARQFAHETLERRVADAATGSLRLQSIGVIWFLGGISLATSSQEIASTLGW